MKKMLAYLSTDICSKKLLVFPELHPLKTTSFSELIMMYTLSKITTSNHYRVYFMLFYTIFFMHATRRLNAVAMEVDPKSRTAMLSKSKSQNTPEPMILGNFGSLITLQEILLPTWKTEKK